jgi:hypothetical protein
METAFRDHRLYQVLHIEIAAKEVHEPHVVAYPRVLGGHGRQGGAHAEAAHSYPVCVNDI